MLGRDARYFTSRGIMPKTARRCALERAREERKGRDCKERCLFSRHRQGRFCVRERERENERERERGR